MGSVAEKKPYTGKPRGRKPKVRDVDLEVKDGNVMAVNGARVFVVDSAPTGTGHAFMPVSRSKQRLGVNELNGLTLEAREAHDYQEERIRFDTLGRKWVFEPTKFDDKGVLSLSLAVGPDVRTLTIPNPLLGVDDRLAHIEPAIRELDAWA